ncbi:DbpA RNA binding domain-containing protein, partial [Pseudoduganella aquatica]
PAAPRPAPAERAAPVERAPAPKRAAAPEPELAPKDDDSEPAFGDEAPKKKKKDKHKVTLPMSAFRIEVGSKHAATPSNIVGAIANEAGIEAKYIGRIEIFDDHSVLELPDGMPDDVFQHLGKVWVGGQQLRISHADAMPPESGKHTPPKPAAAKPGAPKKVPGTDKPLRKPGKFNKFK